MQWKRITSSPHPHDGTAVDGRLRFKCADMLKDTKERFIRVGYHAHPSKWSVFYSFTWHYGTNLSIVPTGMPDDIWWQPTSRVLPTLFHPQQLQPSPTHHLQLHRAVNPTRVRRVVVICQLRPEAKSQAKPGQKKPSRAWPLVWVGFWPGLRFLESQSPWPGAGFCR